MKVYMVTYSDYSGGCEDKEQLVGLGATLEVAKKIAIDSVEHKESEVFISRAAAYRALKDYSLKIAYIYDRNDTCYYCYEVKDDIISDYYDGEIRISEYEVQSE